MNRHAVVTGGAGDIGGAIAKQFSGAGITTTIIDVVEERVGVARASELQTTSPVRYLRADTSDAVAMKSALGSVEGLDIAVLCAGTVDSQPFLEISSDSWRHQIDVNLTGAFIASQAAARRMTNDGVKGHLIFVSSWVATRPWPEIAAYSSSKAGIDQLMRQAALELAPLGIRANAVAPGIVMAGLAKEQYENEPQYAERAARSIPLGEPQSANDIAQAVGFLASPAAATMTGSVLVIDGGCSIG